MTELRIKTPAELAAGNPKVDLRQVQEAMRLIDELRKSGVNRPEYGIDSPYQHRRAKTPASPRPERQTRG